MRELPQTPQKRRQDRRTPRIFAPAVANPVVCPRQKRGPMRNLFFVLFAAAAVLAIPGYSQSEPSLQQLFNGKDLTGLNPARPRHITVEDRLIPTHGRLAPP